jgi:phenylalanine-4-hydroxylase
MAQTAPRDDLDLPDDHPGVSDQAYRRRRAAIAAVAGAHRPGDPIPDVAYAPEEDEVWRTVSSKLAERHRTYAAAAYRDGAATLALPADRVPQLRLIDERLWALARFHVRPVPGLVPTRVFYGSLAERTFLSTQYVRHHSVPLYTPEPDVVHEVIGHANMLANPAFADLYEEAGKASLRATTDAALAFFSKVFWFTLEFGVLWEDGELRAYGAGLLSSYGELAAFRRAETRSWDLAAMGTLDYDISRYQPVLFAAESFAWMLDSLTAFFAAYDDDTPTRLAQGR